MSLRAAIVLGVFAAVALPAGDALPVVVPRGPEVVLVETDTSNGDRVAMDAKGNFVALFHGVFGGYVAARGGDLDTLHRPFSVGRGARGAAVAAAGGGEFVLSWSQELSPPSFDEEIVLRRFSTGGVPIGTVVPVSEEPSYRLGARTAVGAGPDSFVVVWESLSDRVGPGLEIRGRSLPFAGPSPPSFAVSTSAGSNDRPRLATAPDGSALVVWRAADCAPEDSSQGCVRARHLAPSGWPTGAELLVNSETSGLQASPAVAASGHGFVVVWRSSDCGGSCIRGRLLDPDGNPSGVDFRVDEPGADSVGVPGVGMQPDGGFVVSWVRRMDAASLAFARAFNAGAAPITPEFQVNSDPSSEPYETDVAVNDGHFVVVWGDFYSLWGRLFDLDASIFGDGFESGDTTAWSATTP